MASKPSWNDPLKLVSSCASCDGKRVSVDARVLGKDGDTSLVHATCRRCARATLSLVVERGEAGTSFSFATDLSEADVARLSRSPDVTVDDVIELHAFLGRGGLARLAGIPALPKKRVGVRSKAHPKRS